MPGNSSLFLWLSISIVLIWPSGKACAGGSDQVQFSKVTVEAGASYLHWLPSESTPLYFYEPSYLTAGAAAGDYDNDGYPDLHCTRLEAPDRLFRNNGDGTFSEVSEAAGVALTANSTGAAWADVNGDGHLDLYVLTLLDRARLFINDGAGHFTEEAISRGVSVYQDGEVGGALSSAAFGDFDRNGTLDLHVTDWASSFPRNRLFSNDGNGFFTDVTVQAGVLLTLTRGFASAFADVDGDGWPDLLVTGDFGTSQMFLNNGDGTFTNVTALAGVGTDENGMGSAVGDINNDGHLDWFVTSIYDEDQSCDQQGCNWGYSGNRLYVNNGNGVFEDWTDFAGVRDGGWGWGTAMFDMDNDGDLDLGMTNGIYFPFSGLENAYNDDPLRLWQNDGTGIMTEVSEAVGFTGTQAGKGFVTFDYDRDGDLDIFVANNADTPVLFRNDGGNANAWIEIELRTSTMNVQGIGALIRCRATPDAVEQLRKVSIDSNFQSQSEVAVHVGFGPDVELLHEVRIEWRPGEESVLHNVPANEFYTFEEGNLPEPVVVALEVAGPNTVADQSTVDFVATAERIFGSSENVTNDAQWSASPADVVSFSGPGVLEIQALDADTEVVVTAEFDGVLGQFSLIALDLDDSVDDVSAPVVSITTPSTGSAFSTLGDNVTLAGTASDDVGVAAVSWSSDQGGQGACTGTSTFNCGSIALDEGPTVFVVSAVDFAQNEGIAVLTVVRETTNGDTDDDPPMLTPSLQHALSTNHNSIFISSTADSANLSVWSPRGDEVGYSVVSDAEWLIVEPDQGTAASISTPVVHEIVIQREKLSSGAQASSAIVLRPNDAALAALTIPVMVDNPSPADDVPADELVDAPAPDDSDGAPSIGEPEVSPEPDVSSDGTEGSSTDRPDSLNRSRAVCGAIGALSLCFLITGLTLLRPLRRK